MAGNNYEAIVPAVPGYRELWVPEEAAFTWDEGIVTEGRWFKVEFLSVLNLETCEREPEKVRHLLDLDEKAREDAEEQPGFGHYFADSVSENGKARSFCIWDDTEAAAIASKRDAHVEAREFAEKAGRVVYDYYGVTKTELQRTEAGIFFTKLAFMAVERGELAAHWRRQPV